MLITSEPRRLIKFALIWSRELFAAAASKCKLEKSINKIQNFSNLKPNYIILSQSPAPPAEARVPCAGLLQPSAGEDCKSRGRSFFSNVLLSMSAGGRLFSRNFPGPNRQPHLPSVAQFVNSLPSFSVAPVRAHLLRVSRNPNGHNISAVKMKNRKVEQGELSGWEVMRARAQAGGISEYEGCNNSKSLMILEFPWGKM